MVCSDREDTAGWRSASEVGDRDAVTAGHTLNGGHIRCSVPSRSIPLSLSISAHAAICHVHGRDPAPRTKPLRRSSTREPMRRTPPCSTFRSRAEPCLYVGKLNGWRLYEVLAQNREFWAVPR